VKKNEFSQFVASDGHLRVKCATLFHALFH
jgi:hypothetical protein